MLMILRHILSILLLPFLAAVLIPYGLLAGFSGYDTRWNDTTALVWLPRGTALVLFLAGFVLFSWCVTLFARVGQGTLAPWDPTRKLVASGPYCFVRNPMISSVALMLIGEALFTGSGWLSLWAALFIGINHAYFLFSEEPGLEKRFGENYRRYKARVPRWLPRLRPWTGD